MANLGLQNNNPGNLKDPNTGQFRVFNTPEEGQQALIQDLQAKQSGQSQHIKPGASISDLAKVWAPASDNNSPDNWANNVARVLGVPTAYAFDQIPPEKLAEGIKVAEGTSTMPMTGQQPGADLSSQPNQDVSAFAQKIKTKYPQYQDIPDEQLVQKIIQKYPQYQDMVPNYQAPTSKKPIPQPDQATQEPQQDLGKELGGRISDLSGALTKPDISLPSRIIQAGGAIAGGLGDLVNAGLNVASFGLFNKVTNLIGEGVSAVAKTPMGQSILRSVQDFSQQHPELSGDIGAGINIATAIPILKGIGMAGKVAMDSASIALKGVAEKAAIKEFTAVAEKTVGGRTLLKEVPDGLKTLVQERATPDIETIGGISRYTTHEAENVVKNSINKIDQTELQPILEQVSAKQNFGQNLGTLKKLAIQEAESDTLLKEAGVVPKAIKQIESRFEGWSHSYGDNVDLATENRLKIGTGKFSDWGTAEGSADKAIYRALQKNIEEVATKNGLGDVHMINQKMARLLKAQQLLDVINGKPIKSGGIMRGLVRNVATGAGEAAGQAVGIPVAGAFVGQGVGGAVAKTLGKFTPGALGRSILERTAPEYAQTTLRQATKKGTGLIGAALVNRANR